MPGLCGSSPSFLRMASVAGTKEFQRKGAKVQRENSSLHAESDWYMNGLTNERKSMAETGTPTPAQPIQTPTPPNTDEAQARMWNMLCHLSALVICLPIIGPLLVWQIKKSEFPSVEVHGKAALNFQITVLLATLAGVAASLILSVVHLSILMSLLFPLIGLAYLILVIIAGIKANNGETFKYPFSLDLIK
jgi:uncharacterized Tic20 family protein